MKKYSNFGGSLIGSTTANDYFNRSLYGQMLYDRTRQENDLARLNNAWQYANFPNVVNSALLQQQNQDLNAINQANDLRYQNDITSRRYNALSPMMRDAIASNEAIGQVNQSNAKLALGRSVLNQANTNDINTQNQLGASSQWNEGVINPLLIKNNALLNAIYQAESQGNLGEANSLRTELANNALRIKSLEDYRQEQGLKNQAEQELGKIGYQEDLKLNNMKELADYKASLEQRDVPGARGGLFAKYSNQAPMRRLSSDDDVSNPAEVFAQMGYKPLPNLPNMFYQFLGDSVRIGEYIDGTSSYKEYVVPKEVFFSEFNSLSNPINKESNVSGSSTSNIDFNSLKSNFKE